MTDPRRSRREFLGLVGGGMAGMLARPLTAADTQDADLVVYNAKVYTVDPRTPRAEAFAVKAGRFTAVGSNAEIRALAGKGTRTFDAKQMAIVPGFIDCHNHAPGNVLLYEVVVGNPYEVEFVSIASIVEKLRAKASQTPPGTWVEGYFFDDTKVKDKRLINVDDLDMLAPPLSSVRSWLISIFPLAIAARIMNPNKSSRTSMPYWNASFSLVAGSPGTHRAMTNAVPTATTTAIMNSIRFLM